MVSVSAFSGNTAMKIEKEYLNVVNDKISVLVDLIGKNISEN